MTLRRRAAAGTAVLAATGMVLWPVASATAEPVRKIATCEHRLCLVILSPDHDSDGDGVSDVDEVALGTNPYDSNSVPSPKLVLDELLQLRLPSFQRHFTEIVVLPTLTPDGTEVATGLGAFKLEDRDGKLFTSLWKGMEGLLHLDFDASKGVTAATPPQPLSVEDPAPLFGLWAEAALVSAGDRYCCATSGGVNSEKPVEQVIRGNPETGTREVSKDGDFVTRDYTLKYVDGSKDKVTQVSDGKSQHTHVESRDADGKLVQTKDIDKSTQDNPDGTKTTITVTTIKNEDGSGQKVTKTETGEGDKKTTTVTREKYDDDGNLTDIKTEVHTGPEVEGPCHNKPICEDNGDYSDPDYVGPGPITDEDLERITFRLNAVRTPGPDTGDIMEPPQYDPKTSPFAGNGPVPDAWIALVDSLGVTAIADRETPVFNTVLPDPVPWLEELSGYTGQGLPQTNGDGTVTWPSSS